MMTKVFSLIFALLASTSALFAEKVKIGDLYYYLNAENKTAEVTYEQDRDATNYLGLTVATIPASVSYNGTDYSVTSIGHLAFCECGSLTSVTISNSVTSIGYDAFSWCINITNINIPSSLTKIESGAFSHLESIKSIIIPNSVKTIGAYAFSRCESLISITIPESVTTIEYSAFLGCISLTSITCEAFVPPICIYDYEDSAPLVFDEVDKTIPLYVPVESIDTYKAADQWKDFTNIQPIQTANTEISEIDVAASADSPLAKTFRDGQLYIERNGKAYTITGVEVE